MGGVGSGRSAERGTVQGAFRLRLGDLLNAVPRDRLRAGDISFTATISRPGGRLCRATHAILVEVGLTPDGGVVRLHYDARPYSPTGAAVSDVSIDERIAIVSQAQHLGGVQRFLVCPLTGRRAKSLFLPWGALRFGCRERYRLVYASQRQAPHDRALSLAQKIRMDLGGSPAVFDAFPGRPRGMHQRRYDRLRAQAEAAGRVSLKRMEDHLDRLSPGWRTRAATGR